MKGEFSAAILLLKNEHMTSFKKFIGNPVRKTIHDSAKDGESHSAKCMTGICPLQPIATQTNESSTHFDRSDLGGSTNLIFGKLLDR